MGVLKLWNSATEAGFKRQLVAIFSADPRRVEDATKEMDHMAAGKLLREGVYHPLPWSLDEANHDTSEEEREQEGGRRPLLYRGYWGQGQPLMANRKGGPTPIADGGGLCSPGR